MACSLAVRPEPGTARLPKRHPFLAPSIVFGKLLDGQSLGGGRPAELRPAPPMVAHALDEAAHFAVTRNRPARTARNPRTGESLSVAASTVPVFKAGNTLKDAVNSRNTG